MKINRTCTKLCLIGLLACSPALSVAEENHAGGEMLLKILGAFADKERPVWDQEKAEKILEGIIEKENNGDFGWDKIPWETDSAKATARSQREKKPIFTYLFLKRDVGPKEAPC